MSRMCSRATSGTDKPSNIFNKQPNTADKTFCSVKRFMADCKCLNHFNKTDGHHKMKRLKSRKERSQMRGGGKEAPKSKSHHHHCCRQTSKDIVHVHNCCNSGCHCPSKRDVPFPNVVPAAQEPSIITDSRLIGHHGLFNHEVKSTDIERLLNEQRKLEKSGQKVKGKSSGTSHPSHLSQFPTNDILGVDYDKIEKTDPTTLYDDDCREKEEKISQESDLTPGQRPQQQPNHFSGSAVSSKNSSDVVVIENRKNDLLKSEENRKSQLIPTVDGENKKRKKHLISALERTPRNQESPVQQTQTLSVSPSPRQLSSSHTAHTSNMQHRRQDPDWVSNSVRAVAAGLCDSLQFPLLRKRSLVAESREVLMKALQERHGPQLQENLLKVQQYLGFGPDPAKKVPDLDPAVVDEDDLLPPDALISLTSYHTDDLPRFDKQKTTSFKLKRSKHFNWKSSPQLNQNLKRMAEWMTSPMETSDVSDDILIPPRSPHFCMDFEPSRVTATDHSFAPSPTTCWAEKATASQHWDERLSKPKSRETVMFASFENRFMNYTQTFAERSSGPQCSTSDIQPLFPQETQLLHRRTSEPMHFPQEQDPFQTDTHSFVPPFSSQIQHPLQRGNLQTFSQFSHPSSCLLPRSHHPDMTHYPPSHMLDRDPGPPLSSFPSPEHWSFPPMRLY